MAKQLAVIAHAPSPNTLKLKEAVLAGAAKGSDSVMVTWTPPLEAGPETLLAADGLILGTTENLGYMAGALKDFFDRTYYAVLETKQGLPFATYIRAGHDGTGTRRAIESITTGLKWKQVQDTLVLRGDWQERFVSDVQALGEAMAAGLELGVF
ncbi:MAG: NAD(P)H-dependent oxidoreductase [Pseudomonadota bacterium]